MIQRHRPTRRLRAALLVLLAAGACERPAGQVIEQSREILGTTFVIRIYAEPSDDLYAAIGRAFDRVKEVEGLLGDAEHDSDVARINRAAGEHAVAVREETLRVLELARQVSERSGGAFDVTWAPLGRAWNFDAPATIKPDDDTFRSRVERLQANVGWARVETDAEARTVRLADRDMKVSLAAIARGFALDEAARVVRENGFPNFVVEAGGDLIVGGRRGDRDWTVGVRHPRRPADDTFAIFPVRDRAVATAGDYEKFVIDNGTRYSNVIDPRSGYPARNAVSVTVVHESGVLANALAAAVFVLGPGPGLELVRAFPGAAAVVVDPNLGVHVTPALEPYVRVRWLEAEERE